MAGDRSPLIANAMCAEPGVDLIELLGRSSIRLPRIASLQRESTRACTVTPRRRPQHSRKTETAPREQLPRLPGPLRARECSFGEGDGIRIARTVIRVVARVSDEYANDIDVIGSERKFEN